MTMITGHIIERIESTRSAPGFLDVMFGDRKQEAVEGAQVVLFGAGGLGEELCATLRRHGVAPVCFCDNDDSKRGSFYCGIPVISFGDLTRSFRNSLVVIASHKYIGPMTEQLLRNGFDRTRIFCKSSDAAAPVLFMFSMIGTQTLFDIYQDFCRPKSVLDILIENEQALQEAYRLLADEHSRELYLAKLALMASDRNYRLFHDFITSYSQPVLEFGFGNYEGTPEDRYYFNNDVISLSEGEVYVDVGAYDGDTVETFVAACRSRGARYREIHAFEPDPDCHRALLKNTSGYENVSCQAKGVWEESGVLRFKSSGNAVHDQAGIIDHAGDVEIEVVSLDDYLNGSAVTFIKMDPGGNVIPQALRGAARTIAEHKPKLALGAYHSVKSMFEIPILVHKLCPEYRMYLRHNTYHLCDTDLFATL